MKEVNVVFKIKSREDGSTHSNQSELASIIRQAKKDGKEDLYIEEILNYDQETLKQEFADELYHLLEVGKVTIKNLETDFKTDTNAFITPYNYSFNLEVESIPHRCLAIFPEKRYVIVGKEKKIFEFIAERYEVYLVD